jgi:type III secretion system YscQ/HrcQ family protein
VSTPGRPRRVRPYPLAELPRLLRAQVDLGRALRRHLSGLLDAAALSDGELPELRAALGGPLEVSAAEPYLFPVERAASLLAAGQLIELEGLTPARPHAVLSVDQALCARLGLRSAEELCGLVRKVLRGAAVRILPATDEAVERLLGEAAARSGLALDLDVKTPRGRGWARLGLRADLRLLAPPPPSPQAMARRWQRRERLSQSQVTLRIEAGYGFLPASAVVTLRPGDIVVLDHFGPKPVTGGLVALRLGAGVFPAYLDGGGVTVMSPFHLRAEAMADENLENRPNRAEPTGPQPDAPEALPSDQLLGELPVQLTCEIGRLTLPAREVLELRPGAVLPVGRPLAGPVDLTAGGRVIARGELVDVEGEIGVRLTELLD